jgi:macrolide transport system ATP-binding/permease protein
MTLIRDIRYGARQLRKSPGFALTAVAVLALGIGAPVAIFVFVDAALVKPLPYADPSRVVGLFESNPSSPRGLISYPDFLDWRNSQKVFSSIDAYALNGGFTLSASTGAEQVTGTRVTGNFFRTLGVTPALGRDFGSSTGSSGPLEVLLSHSVWQKRFGGSREVLGQTVTLNGIPRTIVGVLPANFHFAPVGAAEFWGTLQANDPCEQRRVCHNLLVVGRLKDGVTLRSALADMKSVAKQLSNQYPESNANQSVEIATLSDVIVGDTRPILWVLLGGAGLLFLIACTNVSSLLLARSDSRKHEISIRGALGASPARLVGLFAIEGLLLAAMAGALGVILANLTVHLLVSLAPPNIIASMPYLQGSIFSWHDDVFALAVSSIAAVLFAVVPMSRAGFSALREGLSVSGRGSGTTWRRFGGKLVVIELAMAVVLLVGAGLLGKSLYRLLNVDTGLRPDHLATLQVKAPDAPYSKDAQIVAMERQIVDRIAGLPGVKSVGVTNALPVSSGWGSTWFQIPGQTNQGEHNNAFNRQVSSGYFTTLQARLLRGRYFSAAEDASQPQTVIINQSLANQYFKREDPVGKQISYYDDPQHRMQIVGVVADVRESPLDTEIGPAIYVPFEQYPLSNFAIVIRTTQAEREMAPTAAAAIHQIDPRIATSEEATMRDIINDSPTAYLHRSSAWLAGSFAALAFLLGVVGLYGVIAYSVSQRTREIGVRMALGARCTSVYALILNEAARLTGAGILLGIFCSLGAAQLLRGLLFGVRSWDAATLAVVATVLAVSALLASYIPARRAAKVDPMVALRYE